MVKERHCIREKGDHIQREKLFSLFIIKTIKKQTI